MIFDSIPFTGKDPVQNIENNCLPNKPTLPVNSDISLGNYGSNKI